MDDRVLSALPVPGVLTRVVVVVVVVLAGELSTTVGNCWRNEPPVLIVMVAEGMKGGGETAFEETVVGSMAGELHSKTFGVFIARLLLLLFVDCVRCTAPRRVGDVTTDEVIFGVVAGSVDFPLSD